MQSGREKMENNNKNRAANITKNNSSRRGRKVVILR